MCGPFGELLRYPVTRHLPETSLLSHFRKALAKSLIWNRQNWKTGLRSVKKADFCDDRGHAAGNRTVYHLISLQLLFFYWLCCFVFYAARCFRILRVLGLWTFFCRKNKRSWKKRTHTQRRRARYAESFDVLLSQGAYAEWKVVCEIIFWLMLKLSENKAWKAVKWFTL